MDSAIRTAMVAATFLTATAASALEVTRSADISAAPEAVWSTIGDFCGIGAWHPAVSQCEISERDGKAVRTLTLADGGEIIEQQVAWDDADKAYTYRILESPLPVQDYESTLSVAANGSGSKLTWTGRFEARDADDATATEVITGIYDAGLQGIEAKLPK